MRASIGMDVARGAIREEEQSFLRRHEYLKRHIGYRRLHHGWKTGPAARLEGWWCRWCPRMRGGRLGFALPFGIVWGLGEQLHAADEADLSARKPRAGGWGWSSNRLVELPTKQRHRDLGLPKPGPVRQCGELARPLCRARLRLTVCDAQGHYEYAGEGDGCPDAHGWGLAAVNNLPLASVAEISEPPLLPSRSGLITTVTLSPGLKDPGLHPTRYITDGECISMLHSLVVLREGTSS